MRSPSVTMPASLPSLTTGTPPMRFSRNTAARSFTESSGSTVMTGVVMMSRARASPLAGCSVVLMRFLLWAGLEPLDGGRQELDDVAGGQAVQIGAQTGRLRRAEALGELGDDDAAQHVARARRGEAGVAGRDDVGPSRRVGDDARLALEEHGRAAALRGGADALQTLGRHLVGRTAEQAAQRLE